MVLVHGSIHNSATWTGQRPLARRWSLVLVDRDGYPPGPPADRIDFADQARAVAALLEEGDHLGGFSYGGVVALLAAGERPDVLRSLMVIEPPCFGVARGVPAVEEAVAAYEAVWAGDPDDLAGLVAGFSAVFGPAGRVPPTIPPGAEQGAHALAVERPPWEAAIPLDRLAAASMPTLVCSSGGLPAYEAVSRVLVERLGAEHAVIPGARPWRPSRPRLQRALRRLSPPCRGGMSVVSPLSTKP